MKMNIKQAVSLLVHRAGTVSGIFFCAFSLLGPPEFSVHTELIVGHQRYYLTESPVFSAQTCFLWKQA